MTELLKNAWEGWRQLNSGGKLGAVLLAALLFLWLTGKWKEQKALFLYTAVMAVCCIFPVTAAALMLYQTRFYDYEWVWSLVPSTAVAAWACARFVEERPGRSGLSAAALLTGALLLCGGLGYQEFDLSFEGQERQKAEEVLALAMQDVQGERCLWAPRQILACARGWDGSIRLLYGRDMWETSLGAYSYDVYDPALESLYQWMEHTDESGEALWDKGQDQVKLSGEECLRIAVEEGANCILLPGRITQTAAESLAEPFGGQLQTVGDYYLLTL